MVVSVSVCLMYDNPSQLPYYNLVDSSLCSSTLFIFNSDRVTFLVLGKKYIVGSIWNHHNFICIEPVTDDTYLSIYKITNLIDIFNDNLLGIGTSIVLSSAYNTNVKKKLMNKVNQL